MVSWWEGLLSCHHEEQIINLASKRIRWSNMDMFSPPYHHCSHLLSLFTEDHFLEPYLRIASSFSLCPMHGPRLWWPLIHKSTQILQHLVRLWASSVLIIYTRVILRLITSGAYWEASGTNDILVFSFRLLCLRGLVFSQYASARLWRTNSKGILKSFHYPIYLA